MKKSNIIVGVVCILSAIWIALTELNIIYTSIHPTLLFITIALIIAIVSRIVYKSFSGIFFLIALLVAFYRNSLGLQDMSFLSIVIIGILATIGFSMIFHPKWSDSHHQGYTTTFMDEDSNHLKIENNMATTTRYIKSNNLKELVVRNNLGTTNIYLDEAIINDEALININSALGTIILFIPHTWNINTNINTIMSTSNLENHLGQNEAPTLNVTGKIEMSSVIFKLL